MNTLSRTMGGKTNLKKLNKINFCSDKSIMVYIFTGKTLVFYLQQNWQKQLEAITGFNS